MTSLYAPAFRHPVLRRLLPGIAVSSLGDGMSAVAIAWLALQLAHSALLVGAAVAAYSLPGIAGAIVLSRWMRGRGGAVPGFANAVLRAASLGSASGLAIAGLLTPFWYVCLLGVSSLLSAWGTAGRYTVIAEALPPAERVSGNAMFGVMDQASLMVGPALAGVLTAAVGPAVVIAIDAASWCVLALSYAWVGRAMPQVQPEASARRSSGAWALIRSNRMLLGLILLSFVFYLLYGPVEVALPVHVALDLGGSAALLGVFWGVFGVGAVIGELTAPLVRRRWRVRTALSAIVVGWGVWLLPLGLPVPLWFALVAFGVAALVWGPWTSLSMSVFQDASPPSALASLLAARGSLLVIAAPLGTALGGPLVAGIGASKTLLVSALATVLVGAAAVLFIRRPPVVSRALSPRRS